MKTTERVIFLSFDDGPVPEMTLDVLRVLKAYGAKATFFCVGENIDKHPQVFHKVVSDGHRVGNHSFNHLNGLHFSMESYVSNVRRCHDILVQTANKPLFRPPYGRLTREQEKVLEKDFEIVMWSVLSGDFDEGLTKERCLSKLIANTCKGSIVVMHDNPKFYSKVMWVLPRYLEFFSNKGYRFECL